jgi:hypothetical protein
MTRKEHLAWAKERAQEYVAQGDVAAAMSSMTSDLNKYAGEDDERINIGRDRLEQGQHICFARDTEAMRRWIDQFV